MKNSETKILLTEVVILDELSGFAFGMAIADGVERIRTEHTELDRKVKPSEDFEEKFQKLAREINKKHSHLDEKGEAKLIPQRDGSFAFDLDPSKETARKKEMDKLEKDEPTLFDEQKKKNDAYNKAMDANSTMKQAKIAEKQIPKNINVKQMLVARKLLTIT